MLRAYGVLYAKRPNAPDQLWEWQQPWIDHLLWSAYTFGRQVMQRSCATWDVLDREHTRIWEIAYVPCARYAP